LIAIDSKTTSRTSIGPGTPDAFILPISTDSGTPTQKDEPWAENPPTGAIIDYYLRSSPGGRVILEILDQNAQVIRRHSSAETVAATDPNGLVVNAVWQRPQEPPSAAPGLHRWVWDFRPQPADGGRGRGGRGGGSGRGGAPPVPPGGYTVRLTVSGRTFTQPLTLKPDPRSR
jgi:hypothetical protein